MKKVIIITSILILLLIPIFYYSKENDKIYLTGDEVNYTINFLTDYMKYSDKFPNQFYLYEKDIVISSGNILLIFFEKEYYKEKGIYGGFFLIKQKFEYIEKAENIDEAYKLALKGKIPSKIGEDTLQDYISKKLLGKKSNNFELGELNSETRKLKIALTFDVESGRYVSDKTGISPCENANFSLGLSKKELICNRPEYVAWMSPRDNNITYTDYPYPQVSGLLGFKEILDYSERYGIPTTNFIVTKDLAAFNILDKELVEKAKFFVKKGLFEVGSHTRYHTNLEIVKEEIAKQELVESKLFLEKFFNVSVHGFRAPYLSIIGDEENYVSALEWANYRYYSHSGGYGSLVGHNIVHKPWNTEKYLAYMTKDDLKKMMDEEEFIITLDHCWNLVYRDGNVLVEDVKIKDNYRALVLEAISNGAVPTLLKDI